MERASNGRLFVVYKIGRQDQLTQRMILLPSLFATDQMCHILIDLLDEDSAIGFDPAFDAFVLCSGKVVC